MTGQTIGWRGAATEIELKERKIRVEDALHATRAAVEEGIVPGGGVALLRARQSLKEVHLHTLDEDCGVQIVRRALEEPLRRIVSNAASIASLILTTDCMIARAPEAQPSLL